MSLISKQANVNDLVSQMSEALEDKDFRNIFERPVIRTASAEDDSLEKEASGPTADSLFETLLATSAHLDELGFSKSAEKLLAVAQSLTVEAMEKANEEDEGDADDKPNKMDVKPGEGKPSKVGPGGKEKAKTQDVKPGEKKKHQASGKVSS